MLLRAVSVLCRCCVGTVLVLVLELCAVYKSERTDLQQHFLGRQDFRLTPLVRFDPVPVQIIPHVRTAIVSCE